MISAAPTFVNGLGDRFGRVVGRHHHDNFFPEIHGLPKFWLILPEPFKTEKPKNAKSVTKTRLPARRR